MIRLNAQLTQEEAEYIKYLHSVYVGEIAEKANMHKTSLKRYNYDVLFELGCHTPDPIVSKLLQDGSNTACNLIAAHGYVRTRN